MNFKQKIECRYYDNSLPYPDYKMKKTNPVEYREMVEAYNEQQREWERRFKIDLEKEFGMENHPIKENLFSFAWDLGHANGYAEVVSYYDDLYYRLVKPMNKYIMETFGVSL